MSMTTQQVVREEQVGEDKCWRVRNRQELRRESDERQRQVKGSVRQTDRNEE